MQYLKRLVPLHLYLIGLLACNINQGSISAQDYIIEWDVTSLLRVAEEGGYPRLRRLSDRSLLIVYENWSGFVVLQRSHDRGQSWSEPEIVFEKFTYVDSVTSQSTIVNIANPEFIQLENGDILLATNLRPATEGLYPFSIALQRSMDNGKSWSDPSILYQASSYFRDGCWEPSFLLLPDGALHIYFANESPYRESDEQEISMLNSYDNGYTWSRDHTTVSFRGGYRDGMPVPVRDDSHIYLVIEDNYSGQFKPYIIKSDIENAWEQPVFGNSPDRNNALLASLPDSVYAGAPYMIRTEEGVYLLSYQTTEHRSPNWILSTMEVQISNSPSHFKNPTRPFCVPLNKSAKWNSLAYIGNHTVIALTSANLLDKTGCL